MFEGTWLGINARTEEVLIGTKKGVIKCRTIKRLPESQRWDAALMHPMKGTHWQPVPGHASDHIPVEIADDGSRPNREQEDSDDVEYKPIPIDEDHAKGPKTYQSRQTGIRVSHADIGKYGATPGCSACEHLSMGKGIPYGLRHSKACMDRVEQCIEAGGDLDERVSRAKARRQQAEDAETVAGVICAKGPTVPLPASCMSKEKHISRLQKEMHLNMMRLVAGGMDVAGIYSPPGEPRTPGHLDSGQGGASISPTTTKMVNRGTFPSLNCKNGHGRK